MRGRATLNLGVDLRKLGKYLLQIFCVGFYPAGNSMFKVNNRDTRTSREICSKVTIEIPE